jgi:LPXTG-site transpeptidase (sortase) family protein
MWERGYLFNCALVVVAVLLLGFVADIVVLGKLQERARQHAAFQKFRGELAAGTAPLGGTDATGHLLRPGTPMAWLQIPAIHMSKVVEEGTSPSVLMSGPGHRRDTPFPGQAGASYILGRVAAFGGPFSAIHGLKRGASIVVTTQEGTSRFKVTDVRHKGDPEPPALGPGQSRLTLETATGTPYLPSGVVLVDAKLQSGVLPSSDVGLAAGTLPAAEKPLGTSGSSLFPLVLLLEAALALSVGVVWSWHKWGKVQTWIVGVPLGLVISHFLYEQIALTLPNLT